MPVAHPEPETLAKGSSRDLNRVLTSERIILTRTDAMRFGDENIYVDGVPYDSSPVQLELFRKAIQKRLAAKGLA